MAKAKISKRHWEHNGFKKSAWIVRWKVGETNPGKQFKTKREAEAFKLKVDREMEDGVHILPSAAATIDAVSDEFLRWQEDRFRDGRIGPRWMDDMRDCVRLDIKPFLGQRKVNELKAADIVNFYSSLCRERGLSPFTAKLRVKILATMIHFARKRGFAKTTEYVTDAMCELRGIEHKEVRTFTVDEIRRLFQAVNNLPKGRSHRPHLMRKCYIGLAATCGLRFGEISGLTLPCIDLERGIVHVRHSMMDTDVLKSPKTKSGVRSVPMPTPLVAVMREWIDRYYVPNERHLVLRNVDGTYQCRNSFRLGNWHVVLKWAGLFDEARMFRFHSLRHFAASWMIENGMGIADVAGLLGHKKFDVTLRTYTHSLTGTDHRHAKMEHMATRLAQQISAPAAQEI